ncbi:MDR efflux pump AcrAB transcriptional activator MarA [Entomohabitans teleogrylli]|uniref:MDR efflux pump AcrAB transcriptional activator MarA n=1 Tax=Entomohabitans teleogrylli TaxID=1384589 RepID=UPI00073D5842|nr:MDR efflux pump AcrAB transcriptional activator MarA [Entomohabitans teleogrylli]
MSRRNNDEVTVNSILDWIEDNLESPLSLEVVSRRSGYSKWHLQRMFKKETGHSLGQYIRNRKLTEIALKLKESNEPILYLAERYGFESQQTLTRTFKNYFSVPPHKYRITSMRGEAKFLHPIKH